MFNIWNTPIINILHTYDKNITHYDYFVKTKANRFMQTFDTDPTDKWETFLSYCLEFFLNSSFQNMLMFSNLHQHLIKYA